MTPRAQELLDMIQAARQGRSMEEVGPRIRERVIIEKFDHERAAEPVLVETVELVVVNGVVAEQTVTRHGDPSDTQHSAEHGED